MITSSPAERETARGREVDFTRHFIRSKSPCADGFRWYLRHHDPATGYQQLLDSLVQAGRVDDACWLLEQIGPTNAVLQVDFLAADAIVFAGSIEARRGIDVAGLVRTGGSIRCGGSITAGSALATGDELRVRGAIATEGPLHVHGDLRAEWGIEAHAGLQCEGQLRCAGPVSIECGLSIESGGHLDAGLGIKARGSISAGGAIRAGESIQTEGELQSGAGYGIYAGLAVPFDAWESSAAVSARVRPVNLLSGSWCGATAAAAGPAFSA